MMVRLGAVFACGLLLAGCTDADWDHALTFTGVQGDDTAVTQPASVAEAPVAPRVAEVPGGPDPFCESVAVHDSQEQGFDPATQANVLAQSYQQCLSLFGPGH